MNFLWMEVSKWSESLRFGVADCLLFPIPRLKIASVGGAVLLLLVTMKILVPALSLEAGVQVFIITLWSWVEIGMDMLMSVLINCPQVLFVHAFSAAASTNIYCTTVVRNICGTISITSIPGFVGGGKTETSLMVRQLNKFWSKIPLLVSLDQLVRHLWSLCLTHIWRYSFSCSWLRQLARLIF